MVRLRRTSASSPGWARIKHGKGFRYLDQDGVPLEEIDVERCKKLVIPPAWTEVWICPVENGHLQAVGTDAAGRRQYLYHPEWRIRRDLEKFEKMEGFAASLLKHRAESRRDLGGDELSLERVVATTFSLLDIGMFRIGSDRYAEENGSYGLTTLEKQHVHVDGKAVSFAYAAKSGQEVEVTVRDERVAEVLRALKQRRGGRPAAGVQGRRPVEGDRRRRRQQLHQGAARRGLLRQGLPYVARHRDRRARTGAREGGHPDGAQACHHPGHGDGVGTSRQHPDHRAHLVRRSRVVDLFNDGVTVKAGHSRATPGSTISRTLERQVLRMLKRA